MILHNAIVVSILLHYNPLLHGVCNRVPVKGHQHGEIAYTYSH